MRREFLFNKKEETINEYMERAVQWVRSIKQQKALEDGRNLSEELPIYEQKEVLDYVYTLAIEEMKRTSGRFCQRRNQFGMYEEDLISNFTVVIIQRLERFNDPDHLEDETKKYQFSTFLDNLSKEAVLLTYCQMHGVSEKIERRMYSVRTAIRQVAKEKQINQNDVTPEMIHEVRENISVEDIISIMQFFNKLSLDSILEEDQMEENTFMGASNLETDIFDGMDVNVKNVFEALFTKMTDIEKFFFLLGAQCCDEEYLKMTTAQLSASRLLVNMFESDEKAKKYVTVGDLVIKRPNRAKTSVEAPIVYEGVKFISDTKIHYNKDKAKKTLTDLQKQFSETELAGNNVINFLMGQWELLKKLYL